MTRKVTQADGAAAVAMLDSEKAAEPSTRDHDHMADAASDCVACVDMAVAALTGRGYRVRPPGATRTPAAPREYAPVTEVAAWAADAVKRMGTQRAAAAALGLAVWGPVGAAVRGRPVTRKTFTAWQERLAAAPTPEPKPVKVAAVKAPKAKAPTKAAVKARTDRTGGNLHVVRPPAPPRVAHARVRHEQPTAMVALVAPGSAEG